MSRPTISLITPAFNQAEFLERTIDSVLSQQGEFDLDYVVLDGGSIDGTRDILETYGNRLRWKSEPDNGQVDAINKGIANARGDVMGWLNSDDILLPGALQKIVEAFEKEDCFWLHGGCQIIDRDDRVIRAWISHVKRYHSLRYSRARLLSHNFISQMTVFWKRSLSETAGFLDESLPLAFDYDYWLRFSALASPHYIDCPIAAFRWYRTSKSGSNYPCQCAEDELVSARHGSKGWQIKSKHFQNRLRIAIYRLYDALP